MVRVKLLFRPFHLLPHESKVPDSRHTNPIEPQWQGQSINSARQPSASAASFSVDGLLPDIAFSSARKRSRISCIVALGATLRKSSSARWPTTSLTVLSEGMWRERVRRNVWNHPHTSGEHFSAINCNNPKAVAASIADRSHPSQQLWTCRTFSFVGCWKC